MARFKRLKYALRAIQSPTFTGSGTPAQPPPGSVLENFKRFYAREVIPSYPIDTNDNLRTKSTVNVHPFAYTYAPETGIVVPYADRAAGSAAVAAAGTANLGHDGDNAGTPRRGFQPAKAVVSIVDPAATATTPTSQITGIKYKKRSKDSFTLPFGQSNATTRTREKEVQDAIRASVVATANRAVSFRSEKW